MTSPTSSSSRGYAVVDLPATFEAHDFAAGKVVKATGAIDLVVGGQRLRFSLPST